MEKSKKGLSLVETLVAMCIATMLLIGLGTSFYMFRVVNTNAVKDSKKDLSILSIRDYIQNNAEEIIKRQIGKTYYLASVESLEDDYDLYINDAKFYLVKAGTSSRFGSGDYVSNVGDIRILDEDGNLKKTTNDDVIVAFDEPEEYRTLPVFLVVDDDGAEMDILLDDLYYRDYPQLYLGQAMYYSGLYDDPTLFDGIFNYDSKTGDLYLTQSVNEEDGTVVEENKIFSKLPYKDLSISMTIKRSSYVVSTDKESMINRPSYGIKVESANPDYGVAYVEDIDFVNGSATLIARECLFVGDIDVYDQDNPEVEEDDEDEVLPEETVEETEETDEDDDGEDRIKDGEKYSFPFLGWYLDGNLISENHELSIELPYDETRETYIAKFATDSDFEACSDRDNSFDLDKYTINDSELYTIVTKDLYSIICTINYTEKIDEITTEDLSSSFVVGVYPKYFPEIYRGE